MSCFSCRNSGEISVGEMAGVLTIASSDTAPNSHMLLTKVRRHPKALSFTWPKLTKLLSCSLGRQQSCR